MKKITLLISFISTLFYSSSYAQNWAWMHGDNLPNSQAIVGTIGVSSPTNKPCGVRNAAYWKDLNGDFWWYGGTNNSTSLETVALWKYTVATNEWMVVKKVTPLNLDGLFGTKGVPSIINNPGHRWASASWSDNNGDLWLFGGVGGFSSDYRNDLWKYNIASNMWTWVSGDSTFNKPGVYGTQGVPSVSNIPKSRLGMTFWKDNTGNLWLHGGTSYSTLNSSYQLSDLWKYDIATNMWTFVNGLYNIYPFYGTMGVPTVNTMPGTREGAVAWTDNAGYLWLYGGNGDVKVGTASTKTNFNDLWKYDIANNLWTWVKGDTSINPSAVFGTMGVPNIANKPEGVNFANGWLDTNGDFILFGGNSNGSFNNSAYRPNLWRYNITNNEWTWLQGTQAFFTQPVYGTKGVEAPANTPGPRGHAMTWASNGYLWLFGGHGATSVNGGHLNDVWRLNLGTASAVSETNSENANVSIYPNPSSGLFYLNSTKMIENGTVTIFNSLGQIIATQAINGVNAIIDLQSYSNGMYTIQLIEAKSSSMVKIVKY